MEVLTREAFWDVYKPGCDEHLLAHNLRTSPAFIPELDIVAESEGRIVGNIMYSKSKIMDTCGCDIQLRKRGFKNEFFASLEKSVVRLCEVIFSFSR